MDKFADAPGRSRSSPVNRWRSERSGEQEFRLQPSHRARCGVVGHPDERGGAGPADQGGEGRGSSRGHRAAEGAGRGQRTSSRRDHGALLGGSEERLRDRNRADRAGADVKAASRYGVTPLQVACLNGNASFIELLLKKSGADANAATPAGETALMTASRIGVADAVNALRAHGADPNAKESLRGQTALMWAAEKGIAKRSRRCSSAVPISGRARMRGGRRCSSRREMATSRPCRPCYTRART